MTMRIHAVAGLLVAVACQPSESVDELAPATLEDSDPSPGRVEVELRAAPARWAFLPGKPADVWAYRDGVADAEASVPGHELLVIGHDGGLLVQPYVTETLLVTPGERYDVLTRVRPGRVGYHSQAHAFGRSLPAPQPLAPQLRPRSSAGLGHG
jgi:FtsP/CotA-like multicopper oxidase with cupredoxin domain